MHVRFSFFITSNVRYKIDIIRLRLYKTKVINCFIAELFVGKRIDEWIEATFKHLVIYYV